MLIDEDDISNDVITFGTRFSIMFLYIRAHFRSPADWHKSDSSVEQVEFKFQRRSCNLSFLFTPRRQGAPENLLAGY